MTENEHSDSGWGWEPLESEDESMQNPSTTIQLSNSDANENDALQTDESKTSSKETFSNSSSKNVSSKAHDIKHNNMLPMKKGITSSPSFQELERAIGATLEMSLGGSDSNENLTASNSNQNLDSLTQHKLQRVRQKQQYQHSFSPIQIPNTPISHQSTRTELNIFTNENESRAIILFHSPLIPASTVRDACQKFGVLYYIRPEFHNKGVTLLCYFDLRSAVRAKTSLPSEFGEDADASAHYSIQLHASNSSSEEFRLVVDNIPNNHTINDVEAIFTRYGQLRSFEKNGSSAPSKSSDAVVNENESAEKDKTLHSSYLVEFFNIQDARLAASELSATSSQIWDESATITFAPLDSRKQQLCRILLTTLSKWRSELASYSPYPPPSPSSPRYMQQWQQQMYQGNMSNMNSPTANVMMHPNYNQIPLPIQMMYTYPVQAAPMYQTTSTPYMNLNINNQMNLGNQLPQQAYMNYENKIDTAIQQNIELQKDSYLRQNSNYQILPTSQYREQNSPQLQARQLPNNRQHNNSAPVNTSSKYQVNGTLYPSTAHGGSTELRPHHHNGGHGHNTRVNRSNYSRNNNTTNAAVPNTSFPQTQINLQAGQSGGENSGQIDSEFSLDFDKLIDGKETRTTIMVRNIPNKYNQVMLLDEVNVNHQWTYDFFYLPIDFKNRCNVGYCFINFLDPQSILPFVKEFNGQRWKSFNSEKVCVISFARIQGKAAMVSRFQNSSLLEKDDEYQPLLFYSSGELKGQPEPFPSNNRKVHHHGSGQNANNSN